MGYLAAQKAQWLRSTVAVLLVAHVWSSCAVWPHHLSYFNELSRSRYHLADSNIDWGQDLLYLKNDLSDPSVQATAVCGDLFSLVTPEELGFALSPIPSEGVAGLREGANTIYLSVNHYLNRNSVYPQGVYPWLNEMQPVRKVGTSILVFEISK